MRIIIITILLLSMLYSTAQNIEGKVLEILENGTTSPIFGANVYWEGTSVGTTTNVNGEYSIKEPPSLPATLNVSYVGHTLESKEVVNNEYIFYLNKSIDLDEVKVKGKTNTTKVSTISPTNIQTISTDELQKAACCNISESFTTNNTVDVSYSDGVSGIKKIQMLGLDGKYIQITSEALPLIKGLQRSYGLSYIPGSWIESIQIIKGSGSVLNGHESFTGQINLEYLKPESADKLFWNIYTNSEGKLENNLMLAKKKGDWRSNLFTHFSYLNHEIDHDHGGYHDHQTHQDISGKDGFLDAPKIKQFGFLNRWKYYGHEKYRFQINLRGLLEDRLAGQTGKDPGRYIVDIHNNLFQIYSKMGIVDSTKSIGLQTNFTLHNQNAKFGNNIYNGKQESIYLNLIRNITINKSHLLKYGISYNAERYTESFEGNTYNPFNSKRKVELITGIYSEYEYKNDNISLIGGFRTDYYNIIKKIYYSPRFHGKYNPGDRTAIRFSIGKAFRISNPLVENIHHLASSRNIIIAKNINPEIAWNYGLNIAHCFYLFDREGTINFDIYNTNFDNQIVVNIEDKDEVSFNNLNGSSYSGSIQLGLDYEIINHFQIRVGYKANKTISTFNGIEKQVPLMPEVRGLINLSYSTNSDKWQFDVTCNYIGASRIPENIISNKEFSSPFELFSAQITRRWNNFDIYLGGENLGNYIQKTPIIDATNPFGEDFDASLIWGPVMGRMFYGGIRYKIK